MWQQQQLVSYWSRASTASSARLPSDQAVQTGRGTEWSRPAGQPGGPSRLVAVAFGSGNQVRPPSTQARTCLPAHQTPHPRRRAEQAWSRSKAAPMLVSHCKASDASGFPSARCSQTAFARLPQACLANSLALDPSSSDSVSSSVSPTRRAGEKFRGHLCCRRLTWAVRGGGARPRAHDCTAVSRSAGARFSARPSARQLRAAVRGRFRAKQSNLPPNSKPLETSSGELGGGERNHCSS